MILPYQKVIPNFALNFSLYHLWYIVESYCLSIEEILIHTDIFTNTIYACHVGSYFLTIRN